MSISMMHGQEGVAVAEAELATSSVSSYTAVLVWYGTSRSLKLEAVCSNPGKFP